MKITSIMPLFLILALTSCSDALEIYQAHGVQGLLTTNGRGDAFASGKACELGLHLQVVNYDCAYGRYFIAEELGDIRAKPALDALVKKMSPHELAYVKNEMIERRNSMIANNRSWQGMYKVPRQYDIHYLNKQSNQ